MNGKTPSLSRRAAVAALTAGIIAAGAFATAANAEGVTPTRLTDAGWTCIQPRVDPTMLLCTAEIDELASDTACCTVTVVSITPLPDVA